MCNLKKNWEKEIDVQNGFFYFYFYFFVFSVHELNSKKDKNVT